MTPDATPSPPTRPTPVAADHIEQRIARVLSIGAVISVILLSIGVVLMLAAGVSPQSPTFPIFDAGRVLADIAAMRPEGFLWAGIVIVIATPVIRVLGELVGFSLRGDRMMAIVAAAIMLIVGMSVAIAMAAAG